MKSYNIGDKKIYSRIVVNRMSQNEGKVEDGVVDTIEGKVKTKLKVRLKMTLKMKLR